MTKKEIKITDSAIGSYSPALLSGNRLYISGQIPMNMESGELVTGSIEEQAKQVMENLKALLEKAEFTFGDVVQTTIFLSDLGNFAIVDGIYASYLTKPYPSRATVEVAALPKGVGVEISMVAEK